MSAHFLLEAVLLAIVVVACWLGTLGMWRMRQPIQALHFLSLPATVGSVALTIALFAEIGSRQTAWKMVLIALILFASNSVVAHASARAFRARELGHWEPRPGDPVEFVHPHPKPRPNPQPDPDPAP